MAPGKGWFNLEAGGSMVPDTSFFEGDSAFKFLNLSKTTRLYGFAGCMIPYILGAYNIAPRMTSLIAGFVLSLLGTIVLTFGMLLLFSLLYVLGTVISLIGTGFLIGFFKQVKLMFKPVRVVATVVLIVSIGLVFVGAFVLRNGVLCIIFVIIEFLAYTWYTLSYIPYARAAVTKAVGLG